MKKLSRGRRIALILLLLALLIVAAIAWGSAEERVERLPVTPAQQALADKAARAGAAEIDANGRRDGGMTLGGAIEGRQFAVAIPPRWNRQVLLFAHGYSAPGSSVAVAKDPVAKDPGLGLMGLAYRQGFAVAHSAYDKAGVGVESGAKSTLALKHLLDRLGAERSYISGGSMGGTITVTLAEQHPGEFAGALAVCGPASWRSEIAAIVEFRAIYNHFTRGTDYALPGDRSVKVSALSSVAPRLLGFAQPAWTGVQMKRLVRPVEALFNDARADPKGPAAAIIQNVASASGEFGPEFASFAFPLLTASLGQDDMVATMGGEVYDNRSKVFRSIHLSDAENVAFNRGIERVAGDPAAIAYAARWHEPSGRSPLKMVAMHNAIDSLVPYKRQIEFAQRMAAAGNADNLLLITVPATTDKIPGTKFDGITHCGFTPEQIATAWNGLRQWTGTGVKPVITQGR